MHLQKLTVKQMGKLQKIYGQEGNIGLQNIHLVFAVLITLQRNREWKYSKRVIDTMKKKRQLTSENVNKLCKYTNWINYIKNYEFKYS